MIIGGKYSSAKFNTKLTNASKKQKKKKLTIIEDNKITIRWKKNDLQTKGQYDSFNSIMLFL